MVSGEGRAMLRSFLALGAASAWMVVGRATGMAWTLLLIGTLGFGDFGAYASAYALAAILSAPIENIFLVRCVRVGPGQFEGERSARALIGAALVAAGALVYAFSFFVGFALLVAGAEMVFNAYKSVAMREGRPHAIMRVDAIRQVSSIALAAGYLLLAGDAATLEIACLVYLAPYLVVFAITARLCAGHALRSPGTWREHGTLVVDALVLSLYLQGDILLLGLLADDHVVGVYSFASQLALAASTVGQLYGQQFAAAMRERPHDPLAGPPLRPTLLLGVVIVVGTVAVAIVLLFVPSYREMALTLLVIAPFAGMRSITNTWVTALYVRGADVGRIRANALALALRLAVLLLLVAWHLDGAVAAAIAAVIGEGLLVTLFAPLMRVSLPPEEQHADR